MYYTITDFDLDRDGKKGVVVHAELKTPDDFNELIKKLFERRDRDYNISVREAYNRGRLEDEQKEEPK